MKKTDERESGSEARGLVLAELASCSAGGSWMMLSLLEATLLPRQVSQSTHLPKSCP